MTRDLHELPSRILTERQLPVDGDLKPGEAQEMPTARSAERRAATLLGTHIGAVAFSRTADPASGRVSDPTILGQFGEVNLDALSE